MKYLVLIPARGGSKGVPRKNIKLLNGKALIDYSLEVALSLFDKELICVSTDDEEIKQHVEEMGVHVPFIRPKKLSTDTAGSRELILHALEFYSKHHTIDAVIYLQPTSPFRTATQIEEAIKLFNKDVDMVVSVKETDSNPYFKLFEEDDNGFLKQSKTSNFSRRQDCPKVWEYNGAIYIINPASIVDAQISDFKRVVKYEMGAISSIDIDTPFDWWVAEGIAKQKEVGKLNDMFHDF